jgi:RimJ/RimL family protein N-acetyltransferase
MPNILIDDNIYLRQFEEKDVEYIYKFKNDPDITKFLGGFSVGYSKNDIKDWIHSVRKREKDIIWSITSKSSDTCIGQIGLYNIDYRVGNAGIGIALSNKERNKGIGTLVHIKVLKFAFSELNLNKITAKILTFNNASVALYKKLGFLKEGEIRDFQFRDGNYINAYIYGLLKKEWRSMGYDE